LRETIFALIYLGILVVFHELGHFIAGKLLGVYIHEFSVGFGPKILSKKAGETYFSWRIIPLGGFVRFAGEEGSEKKKTQIFRKKGCCIPCHRGKELSLCLPAP
jgi:regulator of sigma E protease